MHHGLSERTAAPVAPVEAEPGRRRLPSLQEWLGGRRQHPLQIGFDPLRYPFPPEWARPPARWVVQNGYRYGSEREAAEARQVVDVAAEWERIHDEEARIAPRFGTWVGTEFFPVGS